jgi:hypothetical protein
MSSEEFPREQPGLEEVPVTPEIEHKLPLPDIERIDDFLKKQWEKDEEKKRREQPPRTLN